MGATQVTRAQAQEEPPDLQSLKGGGPPQRSSLFAAPSGPGTPPAELRS